MRAGAEIAHLITTLQVISYFLYRFDFAPCSVVDRAKRQSTLNHINHLIKVMELLYIISAVCVCVGAYDTIKQHYALYKLNKQLNKSFIIK